MSESARKIAVVELEEHGECLNSFCKVFAGYQPKLSIFTNEKVYREIYTPEYEQAFHWEIKKEKESIKAFLSRCQDRLNEHDVILFNTVQKQLSQYDLSQLKVPKILRVHNGNTFLDRNNNIALEWTPYFLWKDFSYFVREYLFGMDWKYMNQLVDSVDYITFPDEQIEAHFIQNKIIPKERIVGYIPLACSSDAYLKSNETAALYLTIPGTIDERRKDYAFFLEVWKELLPKINRKVVLTLLGGAKGAYGKGIQRDFKALENDYFSCRYFDKRIPQSEFDAVMMQTDLIIAPIRLLSRYKFFKEQYGLTKISGSISDVIRYAKPAIFPEKYPLNENLRQVIMTYADKQSFVEILQQIIVGEKQLSEFDMAIQNLISVYDAKHIRAKILMDLQKVIG